MWHTRGVRNLAFLVLATLFPAKAWTETTVIERLIIVYDNNADFNSANSEMYQKLSLLLKTAKAKGVEVVFYQAQAESKEINSTLSRLVNEKNSWVVLATHGEDAVTSSGQTDTLLSFGSGVLVSDLAISLKSPTVKGLLVAACHGYSQIVSKMTPVNCGTARSEKVGTTSLDTVFYNTLADMIASKEAIDPAQILRKGIEKRFANEKDLSFLKEHIMRQRPDGKFEALVDSSTKDEYLFKGNGYKEINEGGKAVKLCNGADLLDGSGKALVSLKPYFSPYLSSKVDLSYLPYLPGATFRSKETSIFAHVMSSYRALSPKLVCQENGHWKLQTPSKKACYGEWLNTKTCSIDQYQKNSVSFVGIEKKNRVQDLCKEAKEFRQAFLVAKVDVDEEFCVSGCLIGSGDLFSNVSSGSCDPRGNGDQCPFTLAVPLLQYSVDPLCCGVGGSDYSLVFNPVTGANECKPQCMDDNLNALQSEGACFYSKQSIKNYGFLISSRPGNAQEKPLIEKIVNRELMLHQPVFECVDGRPTLSKSCCEKAGRKFGKYDILDQEFCLEPTIKELEKGH